MRYHRCYWIYILTNFTRIVLYTGVTNNLPQRVIEHYLSRGDPQTFTGRYNAFYLLYYEEFRYILDAIAREKQIKGWSRKKKMALILSFNPEMKFLNAELFDEWPPKEMFHRKDLK